jgi:sigma-B regulation protein RsbU (phosphoserine phosphatase)
VNSAISIEVLRADAPAVLLGVLILIAGAMSSLLFALRPRPRDSALLYFGIAASMYGLRLIATTRLVRQAFSGTDAVWDWIIWVVSHTIFIPFTIFFINTVAPQWRRASAWIVGVALGAAVFGIAARVTGASVAANRAYSIEVVLYLPLLALMLFLPRRLADRQLWVVRAGFLVAFAFAVYTNLVKLHLLPGRSDLEPLGFLVFLCCQGYVAVDRTFRNEQRLVAINKELEIARGIQVGLLPSHDVTFSGLQIAAKYVPASSVAGDFYHFLIADEHGLGVLVADVSGHGVPAALSASMVKVAIHAQSERVRNPAEVLAGLNSILCGNLQGQFVTAAYVFIDVAQRQLSYSGAGHPPLLLWQAREAKVRSIVENGLVLGLFPGCDYKTLTCGFDASDRCLLYTDGLIEAPNAAGEEFGSERLQNCMASHASQSAAAFCDELMARVASWCGRKNGPNLPDDITIVVIDFKAGPELGDLQGQSQ